MLKRIILPLACLALLSCGQQYDVVVVGGGTGGTAAAIEASRLGARTLVVEDGPWLGGMLTSAGVSAVDGNYRLRGGLFGEFCDSLAARYGGYDALFSGWVSKIMFNPRIGAELLSNMASAAAVELRFGTTLSSFSPIPHAPSAVTHAPSAVTHAPSTVMPGPDRASPRGWKLRLSDGTRIRTKILIDGTELGDVAKAAGAASLNDSRAVQDMTYVLIVKDFSSDARIPEPPSYDIENYRHCCDNPLAINTGGNGPKGQQLWSPEMMMSYGLLPDGHIMLNWPVYGNDIYIEYLDLDAAARTAAVDSAKNRALGFLYFIQNELGMPNIGIADDVFPSADGLPFYPYYREARRIAGVDTMTVDAARNPYDYDLYTRAVAVGDYPVDHHHVQNPHWEELSHLWFGKIPSFSVPLGVTIPVELDDFLVADKAISVSWEMNGGTRLQPVIMGIGQAAGALAALAAARGLHPRDIPVRDVQDILLDHGCYLLPFLDLKPSDPGFRELQTAGIEGRVRGTGRSVDWSNETWVTLP